MIQEAITYMIIGSAVTVAGYKIVFTLFKKRKKSKSGSQKKSFSMVHNCSDCSAECMLRDSMPPRLAKQQSGCNPVKVESKLF